MPLKKILIADDDPCLRSILKTRCVALGADVRLACNGREASILVRRWTPDLVLLDIEMPGIDGLEVCTLLKGGITRTEIPVIVVSGRMDGEAQERCRQLGIPFVKKEPGAWSAILSLIVRFLKLPAPIPARDKNAGCQWEILSACPDEDACESHADQSTPIHIQSAAQSH